MVEREPANRRRSARPLAGECRHARSGARRDRPAHAGAVGRRRALGAHPRDDTDLRDLDPHGRRRRRVRHRAAPTDRSNTSRASPGARSPTPSSAPGASCTVRWRSSSPAERASRGPSSPTTNPSPHPRRRRSSSACVAARRLDPADTGLAAKVPTPTPSSSSSAPTPEVQLLARPITVSTRAALVAGSSGARGAARLWVKSKSRARSPSCGAFSRTSGGGRGGRRSRGSMRAPPRKSSSMNFRYASWLRVWWSTNPRLAYGLMTSAGHADAVAVHVDDGWHDVVVEAAPVVPRHEDRGAVPVLAAHDVVDEPRHPCLAGVHARRRMLAVVCDGVTHDTAGSVPARRRGTSRCLRCC